ncbi:uncharacterized protein [Notamacropus eugenii]|uniref:uncharacterized protein n=1 Tax=Notamacropus eugenii TaxID=9315 RepID=UPI003B66D15E
MRHIYLKRGAFLRVSSSSLPTKLKLALPGFPLADKHGKPTNRELFPGLKFGVRGGRTGARLFSGSAQSARPCPTAPLQQHRPRRPAFSFIPKCPPGQLALRTLQARGRSAGFARWPRDSLGVTSQGAEEPWGPFPGLHTLSLSGPTCRTGLWGGREDSQLLEAHVTRGAHSQVHHLAHLTSAQGEQRRVWRDSPLVTKNKKERKKRTGKPNQHINQVRLYYIMFHIYIPPPLQRRESGTLSPLLQSQS